MNLISLRTLALAGAALTLAACSSEPSDWKPGEKVSLDQIEPGTRPTGLQTPGGNAETTEAVHVDHVGGHSTEVEAGHALGVTAPDEAVNEAVTGGERDEASAESAMSANAEEGMRQRGKMDDAGKSSIEAAPKGR